MHTIYTITFYHLESEINEIITVRWVIVTSMIAPIHNATKSFLRREMRETEPIASLQNTCITNKASFAHISRFIEYKIQNK